MNQFKFLLSVMCICLLAGAGCDRTSFKAQPASNPQPPSGTATAPVAAASRPTPQEAEVLGRKAVLRGIAAAFRKVDLKKFDAGRVKGRIRSEQEGFKTDSIFVDVYHQPGKIRREMDSSMSREGATAEPRHKSTYLCNGTQAWTTGEDGRLAAVAKPEQVLSFFPAPYIMTLSEAGRPESNLALTEEVEWNGRRVVTVRRTGWGMKGRTGDLFFDAGNGLWIGSRVGFPDPQTGGTSTTELETFYSDFRETNGIQLPWKTVMMMHGKKAFDFDIQEFEPLDDVEDEQFEGPGDAPSTAFKPLTQPIRSARSVVLNGIDLALGTVDLKKFDIGRTTGRIRWEREGVTTDSEIVELFVLPDKFRRQMSSVMIRDGKQIAHPPKMTTVWNGDREWASDRGELVRLEKPSPPPIVFPWLYINPLIDGLNRKTTLTLGDEFDWQGQRVIPVHLSRQEGERGRDLLFDTESGLMIGSRLSLPDPSNPKAMHTVEIRYSRFRDFLGAHLPSNIVTLMDGKKTYETDVTIFERLERVEEEKFEGP